jgi:hypothetical protein
MSKQQSDPQSYSVDEMMERLRDGERAKEEQAPGELVTRPDGTQVMRVRKRKRRTEQPEKAAPEKKRHRPIAALLVLSVVLVLAAGVGVVVLMARYNSASFHDELERALGESAGAKTALEGMSVTPLAARAKTLRLDWGADRSMKSLSLAGLNADLSLGGFIFGEWDGQDVVVDSGELVIGGTGSGRVDRVSVPGPFAFSGYRCDFMNIILGDQGQGTLFKNTELSMRSGPAGETQLILRNGEALLTGWKPLSIDTGMAELIDGGLKFVSLRMKPKEGSGEITLTSQEILREGEDVMLSVKLEEFPLSTFMGRELGALLDGVISCENGTLGFEGASLGASELRVEFSGKSAYLHRIPFLNILRTQLGDSEFEKPYFKSVQGTFVQGRNGTRIQNLELTIPYLMAVRGYIEVDPAGALGGRLAVGIGESKIITFTNRKRSAVFSDPQEGFCWVTINLSGTVEDPMDDLQALLQKAAQEAAQRSRGVDGE